MAQPLTQEEALQQFRARTGRRPLESEPQKFRSFLQGATFNTADEIEAAARSAVTGQPAEQIAGGIRRKLSDYAQDNPTQSNFMQFAGAVAPAAAASIATRSPAPMTGVFSKFLPNLAKVTGLSAVETAAATVGGMEGDFMDRIGRVPEIATAATVGGLTGGAMYGGGTAAIQGANNITDALRFVSGSRARNAADAEVQRLASEAGITVDDAMARIARGELLIEDPNIAAQVRSYMGAGEPATVIRGGVDQRPAETRRAAVQTIQSGIAQGLDRNIYRHMRAQDGLLRQLENAEYDSAFKQVQSAPQTVIDQMFEVISRFPAGGTKLKEAFKSETGRDPFFVVNDIGEVTFRMQPTMRDAEQLRRIIADESRSLRIAGGANATIGANLSNAEGLLRTSIDEASPAIGAARNNARLVRSRNENYQLGKQASARNADEIEVEFNDVMNSGDPTLIQAYRLGYLENLNARMESGNKASTISRITDPETKDGRIFRTIYPGDLQDAALERLGVAKQSQEARNKLLTGSDTAATLRAAQREGTLSEGVSSAGLAADALRGDVSAAANILDRAIRQFRPGLTDAQRARVARTLISRDPQVVRRALMSREGLSSLQTFITPLADAPAMTAAIAGSQVYAPETGTR